MLHEKPRPIYIRPGMSQWGQKVFKMNVQFFFSSSKFSRDLHEILKIIVIHSISNKIFE